MEYQQNLKMDNKYLLLKVIKKLIGYIYKSQYNHPKLIDSPDLISEKIIALLESNEPMMIARYGSTELSAIVNYIGVHTKFNNRIIQYILGKAPQWWWNEKIIQQMKNWSGFFPANQLNVEKFCQLMIDDSSQVDMLASWIPDEKYLKKELKNAEFVKGIYIEPFWSTVPWTKYLEGKKVLVVHPFAAQIEEQYKHRDLLFKNPDILPVFQLITLEAVQSLGGECNDFESWFEALDYMKKKIDSIDYDVCLIGCGAYGFPLAAHVKRQGKKAVHLGGSLQLLFGIKGKRWEDPNYNKNYNYSELMNEYWIRPDEKFKPKNAANVEDGCYW